METHGHSTTSIVATTYDLWTLLPKELWEKIFSYLTSAHLLRHVIPVCRLFRALAFRRIALRFRPDNKGDNSGVNIAHDWGLYGFSAEFLRTLPMPETLDFVHAASTSFSFRDFDVRKFRPSGGKTLEADLDNILAVSSRVESLKIDISLGLNTCIRVISSLVGLKELEISDFPNLDDLILAIPADLTELSVSGRLDNLTITGLLRRLTRLTRLSITSYQRFVVDPVQHLGHNQ